MSLSSPFIRRPIATLLLTVGVALTGIAAFFVLPVSPLPQVDFPTIRVQASMPGASPETIASTVAAPLERRLGTIAGVTEMTSSSNTGSARITLQFELSRDVDGAARDVQAAINAARADLPAALRSNPTYRKMNPADAPVLILALTSKTRPPAEIYDVVSNIVQQRMSQIQGVGDVELGGGSLPAVRIELNPLALGRFGISLEDVRTAITSSNANRPKGVIEDGERAFQIYGNRPGLNASDYRDLIIAWRDGASVRLRDVARVYDGPEDVRTMGLFNGEKAVTVVISRQPGANIIETVDSIKAELPVLQAALPDDIKLTVASDRTTTIRASLHEVELTLVIATLLVVAVVSIFLRSLRATLVPAVAVVVSLLGTLGVMYLLGFSLNNLSLMALTVATGFVVDDAIVVLENISRHLERGADRVEAALKGASEVGFTVLSISVSLVAVFIPLLFMGGIIGRLFREFAVTMSVAIMISLVIALTTTPMIAAMILPRHPKPSRIGAWAERSFDRVHGWYARSLDWALVNRGATLLLLAGAVLLNAYLFVAVPKGFFPEQDTGSMMGGIRADQSISFQDMQDKLTRIVKVINDDPAVDTVVAFSGGRRAGGGFMFITLKPKSERGGTRDVINRLRPQLSRVTGVSIFLNPVQDMRIGGRGGNSSFEYTLKGDDLEQLKAAGEMLAAALKKEPMLTDVDVDQNDTGAEVYITVDKDKAARLGIDQRTIDAILYDAFGQRQVATIYSGLNQYHVVMGVGPEFAGSPEALEHVYLPTKAPAGAEAAGISASTPTSATGTARDAPSGAAVNLSPTTMTPLSAIAHWSVGATASQINHQDGSPASTVSFNTADNVSLGEASERIREVEAGLNMPDGVHGSFAGTAQAFQQSTASTPVLIVLAIIAIYIVLGILYESAIHPLTVLSTLPSAGLGAVAALMLLGQEFDLIALIGLILLIGIVKKNAIMIIDFALEAERSRGMAPLEAVREACLLRFRPILMTTLAAGLGALPLAIGFGEGAELRQPLGITIIGGLIASQFITLLTTPVVYLALDRFRRRSPHEALLAHTAPQQGAA
ncbi:efflux RND transporter permease subunit [Emcibacter sp. SYSU 3D8]|uniref:efflux RND transporter permease subunit n=1 Tax=Emcibacter sp. SYSU 3D8 TaxID=3133969 RepID=UPI0031FEEBE7